MTKTHRAVVFDSQLQFRTDVVPQDPAAGEVIVDVLRAGICETDLQLCRGYMHFQGVLGHEFVGIARSGRFSGRRVVGEINCPCGDCALCVRGAGNHCPQRTVLGILRHDGAFADTVNVPAANLHAVPDSVSTDEAVFAEPLAAACRIPQQIRFRGHEQVVVLGDGRLGNLCAQVLRQYTPHVSVVGKHEFKLGILRDLGIRAVSLEELPPAHAADIVVDCTGSGDGLRSALSLVRPCGTIVLKSTIADPHEVHMAPLVIDEVTLIGSRCGPFADALQLLERRAIAVMPLISARYPLDQSLAAFAHAQRKDSLKVLLDIGDELP